MASTSSSLLQTLSFRCEHNPPPTGRKAHVPTALTPSRITSLPGRRQWLFSLTATTAFTAKELTAKAENIPFFGLRKKLEKAEEKAEEIIKEGIETAEKGIEMAEKGVETAEKEIETAGKDIGTAVSFGGLAQAGVVAGAEIVGVLIATSVVNGILGPEAQKS